MVDRGDPALVLAVDATLEKHRSHWFVRETIGMLRRTLARLDVTSRTLYALIEPGSCFAGTLLEVALAADRGYMLARSFAYTLPGGAVLYSEDRFELAPHLTPSKDRPRKTTRFWHAVNGAPCNGTGPRRVIYDWPAILAAGPGATV